MLSWSIIFLVIALISAFLGFSGIVPGAVVFVPKLLFILFVVLFLVSLIAPRRKSFGKRGW